MKDLQTDDNSYNEALPNICDIVKHSATSCCSTKTPKKYLPILEWLPKYESSFLLQDIVAGLTVGLTTIPQAIAYGTVAGLTPQYGLYSAFMGCFVYIIFGTCKDVTVGPTAIMSLMVQTHVTASADYAILVCFLSGAVTLLMGILDLGALVQFISIPVTTGFTNAAAITIASGQINSLFGIKSPTNQFLPSWRIFFTNLNKMQRNDAILGVSTLFILLLMRKIKDIPCRYKILTKYIAMSRNALAVIIGIILCYYLSDSESLAFRVSGEIVSGLPPFRLPPFHTQVNGTEVEFSEMIQQLGASIITIPIISVLESIAVAKAFSMGKIVNASQEMVALGIANIMGSFVSSMPVTGSFTRTAINNASGVKTTLGGVITGVLVLLALAFFTQIFYYIPKATLAAIIMAAMIFMVECDRIAEIWRAKKLDAILFFITLLTCLFWTLEYGIACGIVLNMLFILYKSARPNIIITTERVENVDIAVVDVQKNLSYASAEYLKTRIMKHIIAHEHAIKKVVIKGDEIFGIDSTVALNILALKTDLNAMNCQLLCWNWQISSAGVVCRLHRDARDLFKFSKTLKEIILLDISPQSLTTIHNGIESTLIPL
ncbi:sodium-independent sulfate anion transporter isoform X2 [Eurosta solidaginis]|uniref:sodium-independent sulfate anion transporter isoform X2 n=1 Tax=Eurosta solidaginis TaxID=178769 RepID=UPI003530FB75